MIIFNSMLKKVIWLVVVGILFSLPALAQSDFGLSATAKRMGYATGASQTITNVALIWIRGALGVTALIFLGYALYSGLRWLTARGKEELMTRAKEALEGAVLGFVIVSLSFAISNFVLGALGASTTKTDNNTDATVCCRVDISTDSLPTYIYKPNISISECTNLKGVVEGADPSCIGAGGGIRQQDLEGGGA